MSIEKRGPRTFVARVKIDGRSRQATFATRGEAARWERETRTDVRRGSYVDPTAGSVSFREYVDQWLDLAALRWRGSTERETRRRVARHLVPVLGDRQLRSITRSDCQGIVSRLAADGLSARSVRNVRQTMTAAFDGAVEDRLLTVNPASKLIMPKVEAVPFVPLTAAQVETIAATIRPELRAFVLLGAASGLRSGELRALRVSDITPAIHVRSDLPRGPVTISVRRGVDDQGNVGLPKSASALRDVPVPAHVAEMLAAHIEAHGIGDDGLIFAKDGGIWPLATLANSWAAAIDGMGFEKGHGPHSLRHHHASVLLSAGVNIAAVSKRLGHSSVTVTLRSYAHAMPGDDENVMRVLNQQAG